MQLIVWANGETIAPDLDVAEYGRYPYYYTPAAHNTVSPLPSEGETKFFSDGPTLKVVRAVTRDPKCPIQHERTVLLSAEGAFLVDVSAARSSQEQDYVWHWHCPGKLSTALDLSSYHGLDMKKADYSILENVRAYETDGEWGVQWRTDKQTAALRMLGEAGTTVIAADGYGYLPTERVTMLAARRKAKETVFANLFQAYKDAPRVENAATLSPGRGHLGWQVTTGTGVHLFIMAKAKRALKASWERGSTDAQVLAMSLSKSGDLRELVCIEGELLKTNGVEVVEGAFDVLHVVKVADEVKLRYEGTGTLRIVLPWRAKTVSTGNGPPPKMRRTEQGMLLELTGSKGRTIGF